MQYDVGQTVRARDQLWQVLEVKGEQKAALLRLKSLSPDDELETLWLSVPPEDVRVVDPSHLNWPRDGFGRLTTWKAMHSALELSMNHGPGTLMSLLSSRVRLEPYQLAPVVKGLEMGVPRILIADDVGLGKTVEAGLMMMELIARGLADSILIVSPAGLTHQWQDEMQRKFGLDFEVYDRDRIQEVARRLPKGANPWDYSPRIITSVDFVKRDGVGGVRRYLEDRRWDLVIVDEAHYLTPTTSLTGTKPNDRSRFGEVLARNARSLILLTATPHNGHAASLAALLRLLDPGISDRILEEAAGAEPSKRAQQRIRKAVEERVVRRLKYEVMREGPDGTIAPYPKPQTVIVDLGSLPPHLARTYEALTDYADGQWVRAALDLEKADGTRRGELMAVQFAMSILKRRFLSSPHAFLKSLQHRKERLSETPVTVDAHRGLLREFNEGIAQNEEDEETVERELLTAPLSVAQEHRAAELRHLDLIISTTRDAIEAGEDPKLVRLERILLGQDDAFPLTEGERVIVFTEYRDTLHALRERLEGTDEKPGPLHGRIAVLHGGINTRQGRERAFAKFGEAQTRVLLATDAVREGFNLQDYASKVLHYETPWNPNRMEQRNGRVDRWGQKHPVVLGLFHYPDTYESHILMRVAQRIDQIRKDLGSTSDFLGTLAVRDLERALMTGKPATRQQVTLTGEKVIEEAEDAMGRWRQKSLLIATPFTDKEHRDLTKKAKSAESLLPEFQDVQAFFSEALSALNGSMTPLDKEGRLFRLTLPKDLAHANRGETVIEPCTFDRRTAVDQKGVVFMTPVHPVARALIQAHRGRIYSGTGEGRTSYRVVQDGEQDGYLLTFTARVHNLRSHPVKDVLIPVFVGTGGKVSKAEEKDRRILSLPSVTRNVPREILNEYRDEFEHALELAREEATSRLRWHYKALHDEVQTRRDDLLADLDRVRDQERKTFEEQYDTAQARLTEEGKRQEARERRRLEKFLDELDERRRLLHDVWSLRPLDEARLVPVGCLLLVPEGVLA